MTSDWILKNIKGGIETVNKIGESVIMDDRARLVCKNTLELMPVWQELDSEAGASCRMTSFNNEKYLESLLQEAVCYWERNQRKGE